MTSRTPTRDQLVASQLGLVETLSRRFAHRGEPLEDLVQVGCVALIHAVDRYDARRRVPLEAYATATILGELRRHLRDRAAPVRVPRRCREDHARLRWAERELAAATGRRPTFDQIAARAGVPATRVPGALAAAEPPAPLRDVDATAHDGLAAVEARADLRQALRALDERERLALGLRYLADLPLADVAARLGLSEVQVSRIVRRALAKCADALGARPAAAGRPPSLARPGDSA